LINIDCMAYMKTLKDKEFDLAIVDPPYGIGEDGRNNHTRSKLAKAKDYRGNSRYDNNIPDAQYFSELRRVSKNQIIWGGNYFIEHLESTPCFIVWDKNNGQNDFADCELAWTSFETAVRKFKHTWNGMLQEDMSNKEERIHPNHKPIRLYRWLISNYAKKGDKILDTHLGSGSSAIAAHDMGFEFVGCELDKDYYEAACKRFKDQTKQLKLIA
jgi:site-specific DNA-methyltransferase (adenine-specific)